MRARFVPLLFAVSAALGCTSFPVIEANECGNQVLEKGEDCDTYVDPRLGKVECRQRGVIGACHYDCSRNPDGKRKPCPKNMACTAEGICRFADEGFQVAERISSEVAASLSVLDFDGDDEHHLELLSTETPDQAQLARFSLHYFDEDTNLTESRRFPRMCTRPVAREVTGDRLDDLVMSNGRVGMLPGREDRQWVPESFSSYVLEGTDLRIVPVSTAFVSDSFALAVLATLNGVPGVYSPPGLAGFKPSVRLERPPSELVTPTAGDIVEGEDSPCDELVLAFQGDTQYRIFDLCEISEASRAWNLAWRAEPRQQVVRLPEGKTIQGPPIVADVDGDGHLDVLISDGSRANLAHGDGKGLEPEAAPFNVRLVGKDEVVELGRMLAAGDITGDDLADFVLPKRVIGSRRALLDDSVGYLESSFNSGPDWTMAAIADLNANGRPDVVAASAGSSGITFLGGSGGVFQLQTLITTTGPVKLLASGDFDGDHIGDLAFVQAGRPNHPRDALAIAFGDRDHAPLPPVRLAEIDGIQQLGAQHDGALDDVFATVTSRRDGVTRGTFTLFEGDPDRMPLAPYTLNNFSKDGSLQDWQALALIVGDFTAPGAKDVVTIGISQDVTEGWSQWLIPNLGTSKLPPRLLDNPSTLSGSILPVSRDGGIGRISVAGTSADLEGDGFDEALWLMPDNRAQPSCALLIYDIDGNAERATLSSQLDLGVACVAPELSAVDLNTDESLDLLLLVGNPRDGGRHIEILWNDRHGNFSLDDRSYLDVPGEDVRSVSVVPGPRIELALVTEKALYRARTAEDYRSFATLPDSVVFSDAQSVVATDLNRDGVTELVVADANGISLLRSKLK
jgi:hypothetical protein